MTNFGCSGCSTTAGPASCPVHSDLNSQMNGDLPKVNILPPGLFVDASALQRQVVDLIRERDTLKLQLKKGAAQIDGLIFAASEAHEREFQQLRRFEKDREERAALILQLSEARKLVELAKLDGEAIHSRDGSSCGTVETLKNILERWPTQNRNEPSQKHGTACCCATCITENP